VLQYGAEENPGANDTITDKNILYKMPPELLHRIFEFFPVEDLFINITCVCKKFRNALKQRIPFPSLTLASKDYSITQMQNIMEMVSWGSIKNLSIGLFAAKYHDFSHFLLKELARNAISSRKLSIALSYYTDEDLEDVLTIINNNPGLKKLGIAWLTPWNLSKHGFSFA
jgi:hypothetical protein